MADSRLKAWCNGYEVVAAHSEEEAQRLLVEQGICDEQDAQGEDWETLAPDKIVTSDDGQPCGTVAEILAESDEARHLWSIDP